jgi:hypothetical protein
MLKPRRKHPHTSSLRVERQKKRRRREEEEINFFTPKLTISLSLSLSLSLSAYQSEQAFMFHYGWILEAGEHNIHCLQDLNANVPDAKPHSKKKARCKKDRVVLQIGRDILCSLAHVQG